MYHALCLEKAAGWLREVRTRNALACAVGYEISSLVWDGVNTHGRISPGAPAAD